MRVSITAASLLPILLSLIASVNAYYDTDSELYARDLDAAAMMERRDLLAHLSTRTLVTELERRTKSQKKGSPKAGAPDKKQCPSCRKDIVYTNYYDFRAHVDKCSVTCSICNKVFPKDVYEAQHKGHCVSDKAFWSMP